MATPIYLLPDYGSAVDKTEDFILIEKYESAGTPTNNYATSKIDRAGFITWLSGTGGFIPLDGTDSGAPMTGLFEIDPTGAVITRLERQTDFQSATHNYGIKWQDHFVQLYANNSLDSEKNVTFTLNDVSGTGTWAGKYLMIQGTWANFEGAQYVANYGAFFTDRSLIDKGYADGRYVQVSGTYLKLTGTDVGVPMTGSADFSGDIGITWGANTYLKKSGTALNLYGAGNVLIQSNGITDLSASHGFWGTTNTVIGWGGSQVVFNTSNTTITSTDGTAIGTLSTAFDGTFVLHSTDDGSNFVSVTSDAPNNQILVDGAAGFKGFVYGSDPTADFVPLSLVHKGYVDNIIAAANAMVYKGVIDASGNPNYPAADAGWMYRISVAGKIGGIAGINVQVGDMIICLVDGSASGNQATVGANWNIIQVNIDGAVVGPASATDGEFAFFDGITGKVIKTTGVSLSIDGTFAANSDSLVPSEKAVKTALDTKLNSASYLGITSHIECAPFSPADSTTYYFGNYLSNTPTTTEGIRRKTVDATGTMTSVTFGYTCNAGASSEAATLYIRMNGTTDHLVTNTLTFNVASGNMAIPIPTPFAVTAGEFYEMKFVTPAYATNPASLRFGGATVVK